MDKAMESSTSAVDHSKRLSVIFADGWDTMDLLEENSDPNGVEYKVIEYPLITHLLYLYKCHTPLHQNNLIQ